VDIHGLEISGLCMSPSTLMRYVILCWRQISSKIERFNKWASNMNIYVGNLSLETTEEELRREFMAFGAVISVTIMNDEYIGSGQPRGYGFVEMPSKSEGQAAIAGLNGRTLKGRVIDIIEALPLSDNGSNISYAHRRVGRYSRNVTRRRRG